MTYNEFCTANGITAKSRRIASNPMMGKEMDHWSVTLMRGEKGADYAEMRLPFSKGYGHHGKAPTAAEVLECIASDSRPFTDGISFEDWCDEYGYDTDSRKALKVYDACQSMAERLTEFLTPALMTDLDAVEA